MGSNKYLNIFVSKSCYERISEYIRIQKVDTNEYRNIFVSKNDANEYPNKYSDQKYSNIRIFEYIRHTLLRTDGHCRGASKALHLQDRPDDQPGRSDRGEHEVQPGRGRSQQAVQVHCQGGLPYRLSRQGFDNKTS